jgi:hypothetical protein
MAGSDVARLVLQVDASVELARRNISALAASVEGDTKRMDRALKSVDYAHDRLAKVSGSSRIAQMEFTHVITASTDAINAGIPVSRVFAMEVGRIAQAASYAGDGMGAFGKILAGPWGIALQVGIGLLTMLATRHQGAGDAAGAHKGAEHDLADAIKATSEATRTLNDNELVTIQRHLDAARAAQQRAQAERGLTKTLLEGAVADQQKKLVVDSPEGGPAALVGQVLADRMDRRPTMAAIDKAVKDKTMSSADADKLRAIVGNVTLLTARLAEIDGQIATNERSMTETQMSWARLIADAKTNPEKRVEYDFNVQQNRLNEQFRQRTAGRVPTSADRAWLVQQEAALTSAREKAMKAAQDAAEAERRLSDNRQQGRQVTLAEAESIVRGIGGHVTSGQRSTAEQAELYARYRAGTGSLAARPGHSLHESGQALDVAKGGGMTLGRLVEAFTSRGIAVREKLDEGSHFHIAFGKAGPSQESIARHAQSDERSALGEDKAFDQQLAAANRDLLKARLGLAQSASDQLRIQEDEVRTELAAQTTAIRDQAQRDKIGADPKRQQLIEARAQQLIAVRAAVADQNIENIYVRKAIQNRLDYNANIQDQLHGEEEIERLRGQLAGTMKERRDSELRQLDIATQIEREQLETARDTATDDDKRKAAERDLARLNQRDALQREIINRQNEGPGQSFLRGLNSKSINEQLDEVKVRGLQGLEDELAGVISGTESVSSAFKRMTASIIADLARIAIEKEIILPLANMLFGGAGGGGGDVIAALGASTGSFGGFRAAGGDVVPGKWYMTGEKGPEPFIPKVPGTIIPNHMLGGRGGGVTVNQQIHIDAKGGEIGVEHKIAAAMAAHAPVIAAGAAQQVVKLLTRPRLG